MPPGRATELGRGRIRALPQGERRSGLCEVGDRVDWPRDQRRRIGLVEGMNDKRLFAPVVEDRGDDIAPIRQRPANLDFAVTALETTAQLEDPTRPRRAADHDLRALAQLAVSGLDTALVRIDAAEEERRHLPGLLDGRGGKRLRSCAVIFRILSEPAF